MSIASLTKRIEKLEQLSRRHGKIFTATLKDGTKQKVDAVGAICLVKDSAAEDIRIDIMTKGCGQLCALMNDLLH